MKQIHLHLLGGSGRIGTALVESLIIKPIPKLLRISVYCDSTKVASTQARFAETLPQVKVRSYSDIRNHSSSNFKLPECEYRNVAVNLRGVNRKQDWLNQPLASLETQADSCNALIEGNLWMHPNSQIIHMSSLLCDLIESPLSLADICEGQESYRRPYMISRLHQEAVLSAYAFTYSIPTSLIRLPAVYGFSDDFASPWVLSSLCKQMSRENVVQPRHPERFVHLSHRDTLIEFLRRLISQGSGTISDRTVSYLRPPMLRMTVGTLGLLIKDLDSYSEADKGYSEIAFDGDKNLPGEYTKEEHIKLLKSSIRSLMNHE